MWCWISIGTLLGVLVFFGAKLWLQARKFVALRKDLALIQLEEQRVFAFLHGLGEAFSSNLQARDLHRLLVEGVIEVLDARGGALFLVNPAGDGLYCAYLSKDCPSLVEVPEDVLKQDGSAAASAAYVRFHSIKSGAGVIGGVWNGDIAVSLGGGELDSLASQLVVPLGMMAAPLLFGHQNLGVVAVANDAEARPFSPTDFEVFKAVAEQTAFAVYNAMIYSEASEKRRIDADLRTAREIQGILRPDAEPDIEGFEILGHSIPARHVSGDYYDYITIDEDHLGVVIADVSGKGVPAALIAAMCRSVVRSLVHTTVSPAVVLSQVNRLLYPDMKEDMFISMAYVVINHRQGTLTMARAGHDAPLHYRAAEKSIVRLNPKGMALGIDSGDVFDRVIRDFSVELNHQDLVILYTDGITEALDHAAMEFGMERLQKAVHLGSKDGASGILRTLDRDLQEFVGDEPQHDDVTLIAIRKV